MFSQVTQLLVSMFKMILKYLLFSLNLILAFGAEHSDEDIQHIVGGKNAFQGQFPYQVRKKTLICFLNDLPFFVIRFLGTTNLPKRMFVGDRFIPKMSL